MACDLKAPFSIATTPKSRGGCYLFPLDCSNYSSSVPYNTVKYGGDRGVMVIVVGNGRRNCRRKWTRLIAFHIAIIPLGKI